MANPSQMALNTRARLFGIPMGELGWFSSLLMTLAAGFLVFFATTFLGIMSLLIYSGSTHKTVDYSASYLKIGIPCGAVALLLAGGYLGTLWTRRILSRDR